MYHITYITSNRKTGPIVVTTGPKKDCPRGCKWRNSMCYAFLGPLNIHWIEVSEGRRGTDFNQHIKDLRKILKGSIIRLFQAGDFPGDGYTIKISQTRKLLFAANRNKKALMYTHYKDAASLKYLEFLQPKLESAINVSCDYPAELDELADVKLPKVTMVSKHVKVQYSPGGIKIVRCPAEYQSFTQCINCGQGKPLCWRKDRNYAIGFTPSGATKHKMLLRIEHGILQ